MGVQRKLGKRRHGAAEAIWRMHVEGCFCQVVRVGVGVGVGVGVAVSVAMRVAVWVGGRHGERPRPWSGCRAGRAQAGGTCTGAVF